jgi:putative hemolysin
MRTFESPPTDEVIRSIVNPMFTLSSIIDISFTAKDIVTHFALNPTLTRFSTERFIRFLGLAGVRQTSVAEDEVKSLVAEGTQAGVFVPQEREMIEGVLRLANRSVRVIMTPRSKIVWLDVKSDRETVIDIVQHHLFSRLLVCDGTVDHPVGFIHTKNLLPEVLRSEDATLSDLATPILYVPDGTVVLNLLNQFKKEKLHLAVVVDEYGTTEGLLTLTDVIEAIAGDLPEQGEDHAPRIVQREDGSWLADGTIPTDEVESLTGIDRFQLENQHASGSGGAN